MSAILGGLMTRCAAAFFLIASSLLRDRVAFLVQELGLKAPDAAAIARIPELVQPKEGK
jgi:hypothetical protein